MTGLVIFVGGVFMMLVGMCLYIVSQSPRGERNSLIIVVVPAVVILCYAALGGRL